MKRRQYWCASAPRDREASCWRKRSSPARSGQKFARSKGEVRRMIDDADPREQPLEIFEQKVPVFEETEHAQVHANTGDQPCSAGMAALGSGHLSASQKSIAVVEKSSAA